jgi:DNA invertase Pin-like site-specific DNA recombinase
MIDTTSPSGKLLTGILGCIAEFERSLIITRTGEGRARAKAAGKKFGRRPILTKHQRDEALKRMDAGESQADIARSYNVSQPTISRLVPHG